MPACVRVFCSAVNDASECRHQLLCAHFGEKNVTPCGSRCDNCCRRADTAGSAPEPKLDLTPYARQLLAAIVQTGQRYGLNVPVDVLRGSKAAGLVERFGLAKLTKFPIFGKGKELPAVFWKGLAGVLVGDGVLVRRASTAGVGHGSNMRPFFTYVVGDKGKALMADDSIKLPGVAMSALPADTAAALDKHLNGWSNPKDPGLSGSAAVSGAYQGRAAKPSAMGAHERALVEALLAERKTMALAAG